MAAFSHQFVIIKCDIPSLGHSNPFQLRLPSPNNWDLNLHSILKRVPKRIIVPSSDITPQQLLYSINDTIINEKDSAQFGQLLSQIAPPAIITVRQISVKICVYSVFTHS